MNVSGIFSSPFSSPRMLLKGGGGGGQEGWRVSAGVLVSKGALSAPKCAIQKTEQTREFY